MRAILIGCLAAAILVPLYSSARAVQTIHGVVADAAGTAVPGAKVTLTTVDGTVRSGVTDAKGAFTFVDVPKGSARLKVELAGFTTVIRELLINDRGVTNVKITLTVGSMNEAVAANAPAPPRPASEPVSAPGQAGTISGFMAGVAGGISGGVAGGIAGSGAAPYRWPSAPGDTEAYDRIDDNGFRRVADHPHCGPSKS